MPRFLRRIFPDNPFRRDPSPRAPDDLHRTRRVLVRSSSGPLENSSHRLSQLFSEALHETAAGGGTRDQACGASIAGSSNRPILAPSLADHDDEGGVVNVQKEARARRRLSKRHRRPV
ncbi:hypothetical protein IQ06DRAFT_338755 [Phaeosphaeriaceae sp. SRC1lsM3a]|nr:hypothetical protein IQ06DRAFT_338755 [Stagonospora sp. SRC1lsM3a]